MRLLIVNGSPRGTGSNTRILMDHFTSGFTRTPGNEVEVRHLQRPDDRAAARESFAAVDAVILAFPLYTDAMPGIVKAFIEDLADRAGRADNPVLGFVIQSGFPETNHSRLVERYCRRLADRLGSRCAGAAIKGGVEGIQIMPPWMTRKLFTAFRDLGRGFAVTGTFDEGICRALAGRSDHYPAWKLAGFKVWKKLGLTNFYWNGQLKKNGAWERRFDRPYEPRDEA